MKSSVMHFLKDFSVLLRLKREKLHFSQLELASKLGISLRTYQRIECGDSEPSLSQVYKLAYILNFNVSEIFHHEQKASEESKLLNQSSHEIEEIAKLARVGSWSLDTATGKCYWSKIIKETLEVSDDYVLTKEDLWKFYRPGPSLELSQSTLSKCINEFIPFKIVAELVTITGETRHCLLTGIPEIIDNKVVRVYGVFQDNTKCINAQTELQSAQKRLIDIQTFAGYGSWNICLRDNKIICSPSLSKLFELDIEALGTLFYETFLNIVHPEDRERVDATYKESLITKNSYEIEHRIILPNGFERWILAKYKTDFDLKGNPLHSFGYALDITKYKVAPIMSL